MSIELPATVYQEVQLSARRRDLIEKYIKSQSEYACSAILAASILLTWIRIKYIYVTKIDFMIYKIIYIRDYIFKFTNCTDLFASVSIFACRPRDSVGAKHDHRLTRQWSASAWSAAHHRRNSQPRIYSPRLCSTLHDDVLQHVRFLRSGHAIFDSAINDRPVFPCER